MLPVVMTLDAGGTNMVFSAMCDGKELVEPLVVPTIVDDLFACLNAIKKGFETIAHLLSVSPDAISFAFPGPADYTSGIIGDLPNFSAFRGGVALGPFLEYHFGIPVFINNDGNLFTYGEAFAGLLPEINARLRAAGNPKRYKNLIGITLGTGFGGGVVIDGNLLRGDNQVASSFWCLPNKKYEGWIAEECVSIRGVQRGYARLSGDSTLYTPKEIYDIAEGMREGNRMAAVMAFEELGGVLGSSIVSAVSLIDGLVVIGGGLSGAAKYIFPALMRELRGQIGMADGRCLSRLQTQVYNLELAEEMKSFLTYEDCFVEVPETNRKISYQTVCRTGVALTKMGTSRSIALGAYWFAVNELKNNRQRL